MSQQVLSEVTEDNLIDLGPGSPAVVSPMVGSTAPPSSLSSQLAGLGECPKVEERALLPASSWIALSLLDGQRGPLEQSTRRCVPESQPIAPSSIYNQLLS